MILTGDCLEKMREMESNSISCIVTDPPYGLGFMGKKWDAGVPHADIWREALRIIKPGGYLLSFGGSRTYHRLTCAIEDAGWEIRDCIMWIYGSGFPKSHNNFGLEGYGTALKPAHEPIVMAMKPCEGTFKDNAEKWGQAGINITKCRISVTEADALSMERVNTSGSGRFKAGKFGSSGPDGFGDKNELYNTKQGRWPANVIFNEEAGKLLDEQSKIEASRFFYCAKASSSERNEGLANLPTKQTHRYGSGIGEGKDPHAPSRDKNNHPTVKPLKLMEYLIKLVMPPKEGVLLDPFAGSGTTVLAAHKLGVRAIGIEKSEEYAKIARERIRNYHEKKLPEQLEMFG